MPHRDLACASIALARIQDPPSRSSHWFRVHAPTSVDQFSCTAVTRFSLTLTAPIAVAAPFAARASPPALRSSWSHRDNSQKRRNSLPTHLARRRALQDLPSLHLASRQKTLRKKSNAFRIFLSVFPNFRIGRSIDPVSTPFVYHTLVTPSARPSGYRQRVSTL